MQVDSLTDKQLAAAECYVRGTVKTLCDEWDIPEGRIIMAMRNKQVSSCHNAWRAPDGKLYSHFDPASKRPEDWVRTSLLRFGWEDVRRTYAETHNEYKQCQHLIKGRPTGVEALGYLVRHEFAHALNWIFRNDGDEREKPHGPAFVETFHQLLVEWDLWKHEVYV